MALYAVGDGSEPGDQPVSMVLAKMVSTRLRETGHSQRWLAQEIGVSPQTINNVLRGVQPQVETLEKLSHFLEQPLAALLHLVGVIQSKQLDKEELARLVGNDLSIFEMVSLIQALSAEDRDRVLQLVKVHLRVH